MISWTVLVPMFFLLSPGASMAASGGAGVRGGGEITAQNELYDRVTKFKCDFKSGEDLVVRHPDILAVIESLGKVDWYLALHVEKYLRSLNYCETEQILPIFEKLEKTPGIAPRRRAGQRYGDRVYYESRSATSLPARTFSLLILHEVLHGWIPRPYGSEPLRTDLYYSQLWSVVNLVGSISEGRRLERRQLYYQLRQNGIEFPLDVEAISQYKSVLVFLNSSGSQRAKALNALKSLDELVVFEAPSTERVRKALASSDLSFLKGDQASRLRTIQSSIQELILSEPVDFTQKLLTRSTKAVDVVAIGWSILDELSPEKRKLFSDRKQSEQATLFDQTLKNLNSADVSIRELNGVKRIAINSAFKSLAQPIDPTVTGPSADFLVNWIPVISGRDEISLTSELQTMVQLTVRWVQTDQWSQIEKQIYRNSLFESAFSSKRMEAQISDLEPTVAREVRIGAELIREVMAKAKAAYLDSVKKSTTEEQFRRFMDGLSGSQSQRRKQ